MSRTPSADREASEGPGPSRCQAAPGNPFSTRHVRPGAIAYVFAGGSSAESLVATLHANNWRGEIIGPHGSGKSTLLASLLPLLAQAGRNVVLVTLHGGQRRLPVSTGESRAWNGDTQVVVDGYEQLSWWGRRWLDLSCRARGSGLLVTAHESVGLPLLHQTTISLDMLQTIVARLLSPDPPLISPSDVASAFAQHGDNARELLFALYDLYELRRG